MSRVYSPAIGQINFLTNSVEDIQNTLNVVPGFPTPPQPNNIGVNPLSIAQYSLFNVDLEDNDFGVNDAIYLGEKGGFITQGNKINTKIGDFFIDGNFYVRKNAKFLNDISLLNNRVTNIIRKGSLLSQGTINTFVNSVYRTKQNDHDIMTVGDFREFRFVKGTIMAWTGTYQTLLDDMPYWRLCAPPDSNTSPVNGVVVPNLEGKFILAGGYRGSDNTLNRYQPRDNRLTEDGGIRDFGLAVNLDIGFTGGHNAITLTLDQTRRHNHGISFNIQPGTGQLSITSSIYGSNLRPSATFTYFEFPTTSGNQKEGRATFSTQTAKDSCILTQTVFCDYPNNNWTSKVTNDPGRNCQAQLNKTKVCSITSHETRRTISGLNYTAATGSSLNIVDGSVTRSLTEQDRGSDEPHDNRPLFYALGYIIYVGRKRD
jgi:hypothetical protein